MAALALSPLMPSHDRYFSQANQAYAVTKKSDQEIKRELDEAEKELFRINNQLDGILVLLNFGTNDTIKTSLREICSSSEYPEDKSSPLRALRTLLKSYSEKDSSVSRQIQETPKQGWKRFYESEECKEKARLLEEEITRDDISTKIDTLGLTTTITLRRYKFKFTPGTGNEDIFELVN